MDDSNSTPNRPRFRFSVAALLFLTAVLSIPIAGATYFISALRGNPMSATLFMLVTLGAPLGFAVIAAGLMKLFGVLGDSNQDSSNRRRYLG